MPAPLQFYKALFCLHLAVKIIEIMYKWQRGWGLTPAHKQLGKYWKCSSWMLEIGVRCLGYVRPWVPVPALRRWDRRNRNSPLSLATKCFQGQSGLQEICLKKIKQNKCIFCLFESSSSSSLLLLFTFTYLGCVCAIAHVWRSEDNLWESVLSTMWVLKITLRSSGLVARELTYWTILSCVILCFNILGGRGKPACLMGIY